MKIATVRNQPCQAGSSGKPLPVGQRRESQRVLVPLQLHCFLLPSHLFLSLRLGRVSQQRQLVKGTNEDTGQTRRQSRSRGRNRGKRRWKSSTRSERQQEASTSAPVWRMSRKKRWMGCARTCTHGALSCAALRIVVCASVRATRGRSVRANCPFRVTMVCVCVCSLLCGSLRMRLRLHP